MTEDFSELEHLTLLMSDLGRGALAAAEVEQHLAHLTGPHRSLLRRLFRATLASLRGESVLHLSNEQELAEDFASTGPEYAYFRWVANNNLGINYYRSRQFDLALETYNTGARFAAEHHLERPITVSSLNIGLTHSALNEPELAMQHLLPIATAGTHNWGQYCAANLFLAHMYRDQGHPERELEHACRSVYRQFSVEGRSHLARALVRVGRVTEARNLLDSTNLDYLEDRLRLEWCYHLVAHGTTLLAEAKPDEALLALTAARETYGRAETEQPLNMIQLSSARLALATGSARDALGMLNELALERMSLGDARDWLDISIGAHTYLGDHQQVEWNRRLKTRLVDDNVVPRDELETIRQRLLHDQPPPPVSGLPELLTDLRPRRSTEDLLVRISGDHTVLNSKTTDAVLRLATQPRDAKALGITVIEIHHELRRRFDESDHQLSPTEFAINDLLSEALAQISPGAALAGPRVNAFLTERVGRIRTDQSALRFVIHGLLHNAVLSAQIGGLVEAQLVIRDTTATIRVLDAGPGWGPDSGPAQFRREAIDYSPGDHITNSRQLRLYVLFAVATSLGLPLRSESPGFGSGATFSLELPLV